jgi:hypothetical protein
MKVISQLIGLAVGMLTSLLKIRLRLHKRLVENVEDVAVVGFEKCFRLIAIHMFCE